MEKHHSFERMVKTINRLLESKSSLSKESIMNLEASFNVACLGIEQQMDSEVISKIDSVRLRFKKCLHNLAQEINIVSPTHSPHRSHLISDSVTENFVEASDSSDGTVSTERLEHLLEHQRDLIGEEIDIQQKHQSTLTSELVEMADVLRESTLRLRHTVVSQNVALDSIGKLVEENRDDMAEQRDLMKKTEKAQSSSFMSMLISLFSMCIVFLFTYIVIRLFPKP